MLSVLPFSLWPSAASSVFNYFNFSILIPLYVLFHAFELLHRPILSLICNICIPGFWIL